MRSRARHLLVAALAVGCGWVAAPALSSRPYMAPAVDFEQVLPGTRPTGQRAARAQHAHPGRGPVTHRSGAIAAPMHFDLVGLAGELRPLELRARESGGEWSRWVETEDGNPVYFGGAEEVEVRARGWRPAGTLHYVNVSGDTTQLGGLLSAARGAISSAFISASSLFDARAEAIPTRPEIVKRGEWGATRRNGGCRPRSSPALGEVRSAVVHHTVTANDYSEAEAPGIVLGICRYHRNGNGWNDIGYNAVVDRFGNIYAGRAGGVRKPVVGAHAQGFNAQTTGVAAIGTHTRAPISGATRGGLVSYLAWKLAVHERRAIGSTRLTSAGGEASRYPRGRRVRVKRIIGHRTVGLTTCPGDELYGELGKLRRLVQERIDAAGEPEPEPEPEPPEPIEPAPARAQGAR